MSESEITSYTKLFGLNLLSLVTRTEGLDLLFHLSVVVQRVNSGLVLGLEACVCISYLMLAISFLS